MRAKRLEEMAEKQRREEEKAAFKAAQELDALKRTFRRINKKGDGKLSAGDLIEELRFLGHTVTEKEAALYIWEQDDDNDGCVDVDEFLAMFFRVRDDQTGCEPRRLFNLVDFLMLDKNHSGSVDMDECMTLLWLRYGKELVEQNMSAMQSENHPTLVADAANEKNVNFSFFAEISRRCKKHIIGTGLKPGATTVPQVQGLKFVSDPALQHLM